MIGQTVSRYRVLRKIGGGGMGVVYEAEDLRLHRHLALKFLPPGATKDPAALQRLEREAQAASALNHPNICTIHDIDTADGQPFIAMELLEGNTLGQMIEGKPLATNALLEGDKGKTSLAYRDFLNLWKDADPDNPVLRQAKAEYEKLR